MNNLKSSLTKEELDQLIAETEASRTNMDFSQEQPEEIQASGPAKMAVKMTPSYNPEDTDKLINALNKPEPTPVAPFVGKPGNAYMADIDALMGSVKRPSDSDLEEFRKIQKDARDKQGNLQILQAAGKGMAGLFGAKVAPDYMKGIIDQAGTAPKDYLEAQTEKRSKESQYNSNVRSTLDNAKVKQELGDKLAENDPNSAVSVAFRNFTDQYLKSMNSNIKIDANLSYADLQKQMGTLGNLLTTKFSAEQRAALARENSADRKLKQSELDIKQEDSKNLQKAAFANKLDKELSNVVEARRLADMLEKSISSAIKNPGGLRDVTAIYNFIKTLDQGSAVKEGEVTLIESTRSWVDKNLKTAEGQFVGDVQKLSQNQREQMLEIAKEFVDAAKVGYNKKISTIEKQGKLAGVDRDVYDTYSPTNVMNRQLDLNRAIINKVKVKNPDKSDLEILELLKKDSKTSGLIRD